MSTPGGKKWSGAFLDCAWPHEGAKDNYNEAARAPMGWWEGLAVDEICVVCGSEEVLRDGVVEFEGKLREGVGKGSRVDFTVVKGEYHDQPNIDLQLGYKEKDEGQTARLVKSWIASKL